MVCKAELIPSVVFIPQNCMSRYLVACIELEIVDIMIYVNTFVPPIFNRPSI